MSAILTKARGASAYDREEWCAAEIVTNAAYFVNQYSPEISALRKRLEELQAIQTLEDDWDGEGSAAPDAALTNGAISLLRSLQDRGEQPPDRIVAGVNGTIYFEWRTPSGYREIEVESPTSAEDRWIPEGTNSVTVSAVLW